MLVDFYRSQYFTQIHMHMHNGSPMKSDVCLLICQLSHSFVHTTCELWIRHEKRQQYEQHFSIQQYWKSQNNTQRICLAATVKMGLFTARFHLFQSHKWLSLFFQLHRYEISFVLLFSFANNMRAWRCLCYLLVAE